MNHFVPPDMPPVRGMTPTGIVSCKPGTFHGHGLQRIPYPQIALTIERWPALFSRVLQPSDEIGGFLENRCKWFGTGAQDCALSNQMAIDGCRTEGSSKLPAVIPKMFSVRAKSGEPQSPQNSRVISRPLSVVVA
jgi:hypothetical protein